MRFEMRYYSVQKPHLLRRGANHPTGFGLGYLTRSRDGIEGWPVDFIPHQNVIASARRELGVETLSAAESESNAGFRLQKRR